MASTKLRMKEVVSQSLVLHFSLTHAKVLAITELKNNTTRENAMEQLRNN